MVNSCVIRPPPGLELPGLGDMEPAKVELSSTKLQCPTAAPLGFSECVDTLGMAQPQSLGGEWMKTVLAVTPYLSHEGLHRAVCIMDCAIRNTQQVKALEKIIECAMQAGGAGASVLSVRAASLRRAEIRQQQQLLLREFQQLPVQYGEASAALAALPVLPPSCPQEAPVRVAAVTQPATPPPSAPPAFAPSPLAQKAAPVLAVEPQTCFEEAATQGVAPKSAKPRTPVSTQQTLSTSLQLLSSENPDCLFIVRRINKLGFKASRTLKRHFSAYGYVVRVLVAHSTVRQHASTSCQGRRRPSSLGFVHMADPSAVAAILALGEEQEVEGSFIRIQKFERQTTQALQESEDSLGDIASDWEWKRFTSAGSELSIASVSTMAPSHEG